MEALRVFEGLKENGVYSMEKIKDWLRAYVGDYYEVKSNWNCPVSGCNYRWTNQCSCKKKDDASLFLSLFSALREFTKYHQKESYAELELEAYKKISYDKCLVKQWVRKNEKVGTIDCFELLLYHYDYSLKPYHLLVMGRSLLGYEVFVDRKDFENLIDFLNIFNELFWVKKVYPESETLAY